MLAIRNLIEVVFVAQVAQASIGGTIRDEVTGRPLAEVLVSLPDLGRTVITGADGVWSLRDVPAGPHHLTVDRLGYSGRMMHALVPREGRLAIDITLRPDPVVLPRVDVRRPHEQGLTRDPPGDRTIAAATLRAEPLLAEPDIFLALNGGAALTRPETPTGVHVFGGASDQTSWLLDGIPVLNPYHAGGVFSAWNPDALSVATMSAAVPPMALPQTLSGAVSASIRSPGRRIGARGNFATTQSSITMDGPLASGGWLLSGRSTYPDPVSPSETSYLRGRTSDWLGRFETRIGGGTLSAIGYANTNAFSVAARAQPLDAEPPAGADRNDFGWRSHSLGGTWTRPTGRTTIRLRTWSAATDANSRWLLESDGFGNLESSRRDVGLSALVELPPGAAITKAGILLEHSRTRYRFMSGDTSHPASAIDVTTPVISTFVDRVGPAGRHITVEAGAVVALAAGSAHLSPRARVTWRPAGSLSISGSYARLHQFAQSMRNTESIVGILFPVDLHVGANAADVPVARSDLGVLAAVLHPSAGVRVELQAWIRSFDGLLLVAPAGGEPFSTGSSTTGNGTGRGLSVDAAANGTRFNVTAGWSWRRIRLRSGGASWVPQHGAEHHATAGITVFPGSTMSVRLGAQGEFGRRTSPVPDVLEWESCNLADRGCEFAGSPHYGATLPGSAGLPAYVRFDVTARKHWHMAVLGRDAMLGLSGTITNVLGRNNVLTWARDPVTGGRAAVEMRPRAPLVLGVDWQF